MLSAYWVLNHLCCWCWRIHLSENSGSTLSCATIRIDSCIQLNRCYWWCKWESAVVCLLFTFVIITLCGWL